jgi:hypothetical protein
MDGCRQSPPQRAAAAAHCFQSSAHDSEGRCWHGDQWAARDSVSPLQQFSDGAKRDTRRGIEVDVRRIDDREFPGAVRSVRDRACAGELLSAGIVYLDSDIIGGVIVHKIAGAGVTATLPTAALLAGRLNKPPAVRSSASANLLLAPRQRGLTVFEQNECLRLRRTMADARNDKVDAMDHHKEAAHHLPDQRAALMRLELMRLQTPTPTAERLRTAFRCTPEATSCLVMDPIADLALQLLSSWTSESMGNHDSNVVDATSVN